MEFMEGNIFEGNFMGRDSGLPFCTSHKRVSLRHDDSVLSSVPSTSDITESGNSPAVELEKLLDALRSKDTSGITQSILDSADDAGPSTPQQRQYMGGGGGASPPEQGSNNLEAQIEVLQDEVDRIGSQLSKIYTNLGTYSPVVSPNKRPMSASNHGTTHIRPQASPDSNKHRPKSRPVTAQGHERSPGYKPSPMQDAALITELQSENQHLRQLVLQQKVLQCSASKTEQRLLSVVDDLRKERRHLEDLVMEPRSESNALHQQLRDDLERKVERMRAEATRLDSDLARMRTEKNNAEVLQASIAGLRQALASERERATRHKSARLRLESQVQELRRGVEAYQSDREHTLQHLRRQCQDATYRLTQKESKVSQLLQKMQTTEATCSDLQRQLASREGLLEELRSSSHDLRSTHASLQEKLEAERHRHEAQLSSAEEHVQQLEASVSDLEQALEGARNSAAEAKQKAAERETQLEGRLEEARADRQDLSSRLTSEQTAAALAKQAEEHAQAQLRQALQQRAEVEAALQAQLVTMKSQHDAHVVTVQKQGDQRAEAAEKQYLALQQQYDGSVAASRKLWDQHQALQKDRDRCWGHVQDLKAELADVRADRDSLAAALKQVKDEMKARVSDLLADKETSLRELRAELELHKSDASLQLSSKLAEARREQDRAVEAAEATKREAARKIEEMSKDLERSQQAAAALRMQLTEVANQKAEVEQELVVEKHFTEELNGIIAAIKQGSLMNA